MSMDTTLRISRLLCYLCVFIVFCNTYSTLAYAKAEQSIEIEEQQAPKAKKLTRNEVEAAAIEKMSPDQIKEYLIVKNTKSDSAENVIVPVALFAMAPLCMLILMFFRSRQHRDKQKTLQKMVESGAQIPAEMFIDRNAISSSEYDRKRGLLFTLPSVGLIFFLLYKEDSPQGMWALGLIPLLLGVGYLINWKLSESSQKQDRDSL